MKSLTRMVTLVIACCISLNGYGALSKTRVGDNPYYCTDIKLKKAIGVMPGSNRHAYEFSGECQVRTSTKPLAFKRLWVTIQAEWDGSTDTAQELLEITAGDKGKVAIVMKCHDDPWITSAKCLIDTYNNETPYKNFLSQFDNHPPLARGATKLEEAQAISTPPKAAPPPPPPPPPPGKEKATIKLKTPVIFEPVKPKLKLGPTLKPKEATTVKPIGVKLTRIYKNPRYKGKRIDICKHWGKECGQAGADYFCKLMGHKSAASFVIDHNIGAKTPTLVIGDGRLCRARYCDGFKEIQCK